MTISPDALVPLRRFRVMAVRYALAVTAVGALIAWGISGLALHGFLLGSLAGILGFWIIAVRLEKLATTKPEKVQFFALTGSLWRFALYGAVLLCAYFLDRSSMHGLIAATVGILVIRFVLIYLGITGADQRTGPPAEDADGE